MCGITGLVGRGWDDNQLAAMVASLNHRGPDGEGTYVDPFRRCGLGHNRLSIIDLSSAGAQPMADASGRRWLTFNGEVYNYLELRSELAGYPFHSNTDSEVILAAYDRWGPACVERFIGMFAFAIWDEDTGELFCARDRLGIKPFHYTPLQGTFAFASEIKALIAGGLQPRADRAVWATYLQHGLYDHSDNTFFEGVKCLPPGHSLRWKDGQVDIRKYWDAADSGAHLALSDEQALDRLESLLEDAIGLQLRSDVPLGVNLSGGLDLSVLFAFVDASDAVGSQLNCFTMGFDDAQYDEAQFAADVPRRKQWNQHVVRLDAPTAWSQVDPLMRAEEAPFGGIGTLAYYNLHRHTRDVGVTVVLEGQGIDEMFGGYAYYQAPDQPGIYQDGSSFLRPATLSEEMRDQRADLQPFAAPFGTSLDNRLYRDIRYSKLPRVLRMNDRLSMAFSLELRPPFLDHRVVELAFRLDEGKKIRQGQGKFIIRRLLDRINGHPLAQAPKRAVVTPQREWLRGPLREPIEDLIASTDFQESGYFDPVAVKREFDAYCAGEGDNAFFVWQWINLDAWRRTFSATL